MQPIICSEDECRIFAKTSRCKKANSKIFDCEQHTTFFFDKSTHPQIDAILQCNYVNANILQDQKSFLYMLPQWKDDIDILAVCKSR